MREEVCVGHSSTGDPAVAWGGIGNGGMWRHELQRPHRSSERELQLLRPRQCWPYQEHRPSLRLSWPWHLKKNAGQLFWKMSLHLGLSEVSSWLNSGYAFWVRISQKGCCGLLVPHIGRRMWVCLIVGEVNLVKEVSTGFLRYRITFCLCTKYLGEEGDTKTKEVSPGSHRALRLLVVASVYDSYRK